MTDMEILAAETRGRWDGLLALAERFNRGELMPDLNDSIRLDIVHAIRREARAQIRTTTFLDADA